MKIISHRGYWLSPNEKNTEAAFRRSFEACFGIETDIRDLQGELVISHDMPIAPAMSMEALLQLVGSYSCQEKLTIALNIKSDGLAEMVSDLLGRFRGLDCFVFDMAVPDMRSYLQIGVPVFTRLSEVEQPAVWLDQCAGVWLDCFEREWYTTSLVEDLLADGKQVCIVSPELHDRPYEKQWKTLREIDDTNLMICTDFPNKAADYFQGDQEL
jgi:hypothetical protein